MKIIERKSEYPKRITCNKCATVLEYDLNDVIITSYSYSPENSQTLWNRKFIVCPVCGDKVYITVLSIRYIK